MYLCFYSFEEEVASKYTSIIKEHEHTKQELSVSNAEIEKLRNTITLQSVSVQNRGYASQTVLPASRKPAPAFPYKHRQIVSSTVPTATRHPVKPVTKSLVVTNSRTVVPAPARRIHANYHPTRRPKS